ncbi:hypothetical protein KCTC52924_00428 [Arenibacter antarcticus]|uniref:Phage tail sheath family protein n=1 Tax=Arenibacter antarcticus TaxID=2040469 RepID=A0ABW5VDD1_9FLAO|nr:phage tail sheath C-terminal domain-containing protein [Arenibacter sp. H213]MCM4169395.1 phage tail sheath family protein [Arenibacter sp. H213]
MNKRFALSFLLFFVFSYPILSQVNNKVIKEKVQNEHRIPKRNVMKANKIHDIKRAIDLERPGTPEVYSHEVPSSNYKIAQVETAIPAFIGYTEKGSINPTKISSMEDYRNKFGGASNEDIGEFYINSDGTITSPSILTTPKYRMYYMLELFFANGGGDCFITSVGHYDTENSIRNEKMLNGLTLLNNEDLPTLILFPDATSSKNIDDPAELYKAALAQCAERKDRFLICDVEESNNDIAQSAEKFRFSIGTENLKYGAAYFPSLHTTLNYNYSEDMIQVKLKNSHKIFVLRYTEASISRDSNKTEESLYHAENGKYRQRYQEIKQIINAKNLELPPSAAIAGVYVESDASRGVWKAPVNVSLNKVKALKLEIDNNAQAYLNVDSSGKSINAIRSFKGKGIMVWGARTMAGNDNDWKYIQASRLGLTIKTSVRNALERLDKLPNDANTWNIVKTMTTNYLHSLWREGALNGTKQEEAYYVRVGLGETMMDQDLDEGKLILEIGIATTRPAEFSILRISQNMRNN